MALTATIFKARVQLSDLDRHHYDELHLTLARHPSETDERMMVRLLAFVLNAAGDLQFSKGLCVDDEPDIWRKEPTGDIAVWIDVGLPDARRIRKACGRAREVRVYAYGGRSAALWWERTAAELRRFDNLRVYDLPQEASTGLTALVARSMRLQCTVQDGQAWFGDDTTTVEVAPVPLLEP